MEDFWQSISYMESKFLKKLMEVTVWNLGKGSESFDLTVELSKKVILLF